ncbi:MAG: hypothetical protein RL316_453 [Bacteroidota bacterium]|jgi:hypothetical protein
MIGVYYLGKENAIDNAVKSEEVKKLLYAYYRGVLSDKAFLLALKNLLKRFNNLED